MLSLAERYFYDMVDSRKSLRGKWSLTHCRASQPFIVEYHIPRRRHAIFMASSHIPHVFIRPDHPYPVDFQSSGDPPRVAVISERVIQDPISGGPQYPRQSLIPRPHFQDIRRFLPTREPDSIRHSSASRPNTHTSLVRAPYSNSIPRILFSRFYTHSAHISVNTV